MLSSTVQVRLLYQVYEGNDIVIPCQVPKSVPPAFVQFVRNGEVNGFPGYLINGDTLLLTNVTTNLSGNYRFGSSDTFTNFKLRMYELFLMNIYYDFFFNWQTEKKTPVLNQ